VSLPAGFGAPPSRPGTPRPRPSRADAPPSGDVVAAPMRGTIVEVAVRDGQAVARGELIAVIEAMKMEQPLNAHKDGSVVGLKAVVGQNVGVGTALCEIRSGR
jgi:acetyl-CoA/propionyl-CoA carboxylase, biotin carboxylase, biotin carboxyl carrier protein